MNSEAIGKLAFNVVYVNVRFPIPVTDNYTMTTDIQKKKFLYSLRNITGCKFWQSYF